MTATVLGWWELASPPLNATLNAASAICLLAGWWCIRRKHIAAHVTCMLSALAMSVSFLVSYLIYHARVGSVPFPRTDWIRSVYLTILVTHTILAVVILPLIGRTLWFAGRRQFAQHRAIARWTLPMWLYVSVSGVVVYWLLYRTPWGD